MKPPAPAIRWLGPDPVVRFAAAELSRYLERMTGRAVPAVRAVRYDAAQPALWVGLAADITGKPEPAGGEEVVRVEAGQGSGILTGSLPRCVLVAVYRYLEELGCRWFRPGPDGERVPKLKTLKKTVALTERPAARHRCICIEGSCSEEHVRAVLDYAPKRGFNAYFTQFRNSYTFFERWYGLERNRKPVRTEFPSSRALAIQERCKREAVKRGLLLHTVGHGWTCEPLGIKGEEWAPSESTAAPDQAKYLAMVNGKRELFRGIPLNTQLCFSNPRVRELMAGAVADYAAAHPAEAMIHVWLGDGSNNHCECAGCRKAIPSDWYVRILNRMDELLTERKLPVRIVFLAYVDLLWAPERERIRNPDRFILMFAPITRSYKNSFHASVAGKVPPVPDYTRNTLAFPDSPAANLAMLARWRKGVTGECVDFDYHLWRAHHNDPGQMHLARVLHEDVQSLREMGMDGFISCQCQRVAFPTGLYWHVMGQGLWNAEEDFDILAGRYLEELFGPGWKQVRGYLARLSDLMGDLLNVPASPEENVRHRRWLLHALPEWKQVPALAATIKPAIRRGLRSRDPVTASAWRILSHHSWYVSALSRFLVQAWSADPTATAACAALADELDRRLPDLHPVFDTWMCKALLQHALWVNGLPFEERIMVRRKARTGIFHPV